MVKTYEEFIKVVDERIETLGGKVSIEYLSEAGLSALEAYRAIAWYASFYDSFSSLKEDESFSQLSSIADKHPEYYRVLRSVSRFLEKV